MSSVKAFQACRGSPKGCVLLLPDISKASCSLTSPAFVVLFSGPLLIPLALHPLTHAASVLPPPLAFQSRFCHSHHSPGTHLCPLFLHLIRLAGSLCYCPYSSHMANCVLGTAACMLPTMSIFLKKIYTF